MKRGKLWGEDFLRLGVWLEDPKLTGFTFQSEQGETINLGPFWQVMGWLRGGDSMTEYFMVEKSGRKFHLEVLR